MFRITNALWSSTLLISWFVRVKQELERSEEKRLGLMLWIEPLPDGKVLISWCSIQHIGGLITRPSPGQCFFLVLNQRKTSEETLEWKILDWFSF